MQIPVYHDLVSKSYRLLSVDWTGSEINRLDGINLDAKVIDFVESGRL